MKINQFFSFINFSTPNCTDRNNLWMILKNYRQKYIFSLAEYNILSQLWSQIRQRLFNMPLHRSLACRHKGVD